jgi:glycosyltransferase involved in cell wall biosynthesis
LYDLTNDLLETRNLIESSNPTLANHLHDMLRWYLRRTMKKTREREPLSEPDISVVIPTRNRIQSLRRTLDALARQTYAADRFEVLVSANGCSDETGPMVRNLVTPYSLQLIEISMPGMSLARNTGARAARGRILLFLDDDIEPLPTLVEAHTRAHQSCCNLIAIGPYLAPPLPQPPSFFVERLRNLDTAFAALLAETQGFLDWFCMTGGNFSISTALFWKAGGFDTALVAYGSEDYEFGCRAQKVGACFTFLPEAGGYHHRHEHNSVESYLQNGRSIGHNDVHVACRHPEIVERIRLGLVTKPQTMLGRLGRTLAFDYPWFGDALAKGVLPAGNALLWLRLPRQWNRLIDCLYQYWYFRGVADTLGGYRVVVASLLQLRASQNAANT